MRKIVCGGLFFAVNACLLVACGDDEPLVDGVFTQDEWTKVQTLGPLPTTPPVDTTNKYADDPAAATLGQKFFYDTRSSGPIINAKDATNGGYGAANDTGKISCGNCHSPPAFIDNHSGPNNITLGADWFPRNTPTLLNVSFYTGFNDFEGISDSPWVDAMGGTENPALADANRLSLAHFIYANYKDAYNAIFTPVLDPGLDPAAADAARFPAAGAPKASAMAPDGPWEGMAPADQTIVNRIFVNYAKATEAFMRKLVSGNAPFDRYIAGDTTAISDSAKRGVKLFVGKGGCAECHAGAHLSDDKFYNTTIIDKYPDAVKPGSQMLFDALAGFFAAGHQGGIGYATMNPTGRDSEYSDDQNTPLLKGLTPDDKYLATYRTTGLRNVDLTAPYMHAGQLATLEDVVKFYNDGGSMDGSFPGVKDDKIKKLNLSDPEIADMVAMLKTLTGDPVPAELTMAPSP